MISENIVSFREIYAYLGFYGNDKPDEKVRRQIDQTIEKLLEVCNPTFYSQILPLTFEKNLPVIGGCATNSQSLAKNLMGCDSVVVFGCTLGPEPDHLIRRSQVTSSWKAELLQAVSASMIEQYCRKVNEQLEGEAREEGFQLRPRYSPGYGDLSLDWQTELFRLTDLTKHTGISLTESCQMVPSKSVTALAGREKIEK